MNTKFIVLSLIFAFIIPGTLFGQGNYKTLVYEGNKKFNSKDYDGASSKYMEAIKSKDEDFTAHYNLGNALYKKKMYQEAQDEYAKAERLSATLPDKAAALHNLGNTMMQLNKPDKAAEYYKQSLKQDPYNEATRKNYEIAKLKQKEQQRNEDKDNNSGKGGGGEDQNKGEQGDSKNKKQDQGNGPQQDKGEDQKPEGKSGKGKQIPKDVEKAILDSISGREKRTARRILDEKSYSTPQSNEKDW